jgi:hypothetical protein
LITPSQLQIPSTQVSKVSQNGIPPVSNPAAIVYIHFRHFPTTTKLANTPQADAGLPAGWEVRHSNSKNLPYYFNESQKQSRWEPPAGTDTEKLKTYMAEHHSAPTIPEGANGNAGNSGKIRASHLLVKHKDSRRPSSWREVRLSSKCRPFLAALLICNPGRDQTHQRGSYEHYSWS